MVPGSGIQFQEQLEKLEGKRMNAAAKDGIRCNSLFHYLWEWLAMHVRPARAWVHVRRPPSRGPNVLHCVPTRGSNVLYCVPSRGPNVLFCMSDGRVDAGGAGGFGRWRRTRHRVRELHGPVRQRQQQRQQPRRAVRREDARLRHSCWRRNLQRGSTARLKRIWHPRRVPLYHATPLAQFTRRGSFVIQLDIS
jgi:hypothetical protein